MREECGCKATYDDKKLTEFHACSADCPELIRLLDSLGDYEITSWETTGPRVSELTAFMRISPSEVH